jgi:hypothetical protein
MGHLLFFGFGSRAGAKGAGWRSSEEALGGLGEEDTPSARQRMGCTRGVVNGFPGI